MEKFLILAIFLTVVCSGQKFPFRIKNFSISNCKNQLVTLENIDVGTDKRGNLLFSGSMNSKTDLESPIKMSLAIKRNIWGIWIPVPCIDGIGSCTYTDLCKYGAHDNEICPQVLSENKVPCRCPIPTGNYTVPQTISLFSEGYNNIETGKYFGKANIYHKNTKLGCYTFKFTLY